MSEELLTQAWSALDGPAELLDQVALSGPPGTLPAPLRVTELATATVGCAGLAAAEFAVVRGSSAAYVRVDSRGTAVAFTSERHLRVAGAGPGAPDALWRSLPAADGWIRLHANYPHHRARLLRALRVGSPEAVVEAVAGRPVLEVEDAVVQAGGVAAAVRTAAQWQDHPQGAAVAALPLLTTRPVGLAPPARYPANPTLPADGIRILDLTRVIAGPVGTRTLALLGADVLRVDSPRLPELEWQHRDTDFGKRSTLLDLDSEADRSTFHDLLERADVVVAGYRAGALTRLGLDPVRLAERRPGIVVATLSAWGATGPWAGRRGFDSLVQAASGIGDLCGGPEGPGALPAQALDHGTGYLLAAGVLRALTRRALEGGSWHVELSLAQTARWLLSGGVTPLVDNRPDPAPWLATAGDVTYALSPVVLSTGPRTWAHPPTPWGSDKPVWN